jgi:hypothetical protein
LFSAKNTSDQIITNLLDAALVEKARHRKTNVDEVDKLQHRDAGMAWLGIEKQVGDFATAVGKTDFIVERLDSFANALSRFTSTIESGGTVPLEARGGRLINRLKGNDAPLEGKIPMPKGDPRRLPDGSILPMPTSDPRNQIPDFPEGLPLSIRDPRRMHNGKRIPAPMSDPRNEGESWSPPPGSGRAGEGGRRGKAEL